MNLDDLPILDLSRRLAVWVEPTELTSPVSRDPDDDWVRATAVAGEADAIITGDDDLLILRRYRDVRILSPRKFLEIRNRRV